nr:hypothetical protein [Tanacetum cinerariifolium]
MENVLKENDRLLTHALSVEIVNIVVNDCMNVHCLNVDDCEHRVTTESELKTDFIKKEYYAMLLKQYHSLEKHCISLEVNNQLNTEIFQRDTMSSSESASTFAELFKTKELKAQIQEKNTVILKLKEKIKSSNGDVKERKVERKVEEIETQNLELDHKVDVVLLVPKLRKNRIAHIDYIRHTQEEAATLRELVESKRLLSPLNTSLAYALAVTPKNQTKQIRRIAQITKSEKPSVATSPSSNIDSNTLVLSSTRVALVSSASRSQSQDNTKKNRIQQTQKKSKETELEDHLRKVKSSLNKASVVDSRATSSVIKSVSNVNSNLKCASCNGCLFSNNHDACVVEYINSVNAIKKSKSVKKPVKRKVWKTTGKVFKTVGYIWKPTGRTFTLVGNVCPLTRIATATIVPPREPIPIVQSTDKPVVTLVVQIVLWYLDSGCSKHITGDRSQLINFIQKFLGTVKFGNDHVAKIMGYGDYQIGNHMTGDRSQLINFVQKFLGTVKFGNDHVAKIMGYGDYQIGNVTISRVYYVEGLGHNLFSIGQFCDSDLEVAFRQHTCFISNLKGVDLLTNSKGNNLYTLSLQDMMA